MKVKFLILTTSLLMLSMGLFGQDKAAKKVLDKLAKSYESVSSVTMDLAITIAYPEREEEHQKATVAQSGDFFFYKANDQQIYCNGADVWYYLIDRNEVQINDYEEGEDESTMTPTGLLNQYRDGQFSYALTHKESGYAYIELIPKDEYSEYAKYRLKISNSNNQLSSIEMMGKDGSKITVAVASTKLGLPYEQSDFTFSPSKYPGILIEDLRL